MTDRWSVIELAAAQTHGLRRTVLRAGTPTDEVRFAGDEWPGAVHLGVLDDGEVVGTSTWIPQPFEDDPEAAAVQLRGMATAPSHRGRGVGAALLDAGRARALDAGAVYVWANARDAALTFYTRNGFTVVGDGFVDATTLLPHHVVVHRLR